jgi:hypothetical protein
MNLPKLLSLLPTHPRKAYQNAILNKPWAYGMYIACEIYDGNESNHKLIFFDRVEQLVDFIPVLLLSNIAILDDDVTYHDSIDYTELYNLYNKYRKIQKLTLDVIAELEKDWGFINVLNVGFISTFFNISLDAADYIKNNPKIVDYNEFEKTGVNMSEYYILSGFIKKFDTMPSELPAEFLEYIISLNSL